MRHAGKLRPVRGIVGSATVGAASRSGFAASAVLTLDGRHVVASTAATELVPITLDGSQASTMVIPGVPANPTRRAASLKGIRSVLLRGTTQVAHRQRVFHRSHSNRHRLQVDQS